MLIIHKIEQTHFSASESVIVDYILENGESIKDMSIAAIAKETFTSAPLLVRIAKKLGYSGWNEFKDAYFEELDYLYRSEDVDASIPFVVGDNFTKITSNIAELEMNTIKDTLSLLKHDDLAKALSLFKKAQTIDIYTHNSYLSIAETFAHQMFQIDKNVVVNQLVDEEFIQALKSNSSHIAIIISYSGMTSSMLEIAKQLKKQQTPIIGLTSVGENKLSTFSDVTFRISSREMLHTKIGEFATSTSVKYLLDIIYAGIFSLDYQKNLDEKLELAALLGDRYSAFEYIDE